MTIHDRAEYGRYLRAFMGVFSKFNGEILAAAPVPVPMEGDWPYDRTILLRWPTNMPDPDVKVGGWIADVTYERNQAVVYRGPFKEVLDDDDHCGSSFVFVVADDQARFAVGVELFYGRHEAGSGLLGIGSQIHGKTGHGRRRANARA